ncbi:MAG: sigma-54-dependent Fis family transcriptional regulator [Alphaproteobacteria bacterium]|nr:sigma-54-dependent Fis family transcriptional regulator [Alphaproteobacteria bacterium]
MGRPHLNSRAAHTGNAPLVLLVEDMQPMARMYLGHLRNAAVTLAHVETGQAALSAIRQNRPAVVVLDLRLPDMDGLSLLRRLRDEGLRPVVLAITAHGADAVADEAVRLGAFDVLTKPVSAERLRYALAAALDWCATEARLAELALAAEQVDPGVANPGAMLGESLPMRRLFARIAALSPSGAPALILGEPGSGRSLVAASLHAQGPRAQRALVVFDTAMLPRHAAEVELFGLAGRAAPGAIAEAEGGTLLIEDIDALDPASQLHLLRLLQTGTYRRAGGASLERADIRLLATASLGLRASVSAGRFREDLFHRLAAASLLPPPLRERGPDVLRLARAFLARMSVPAGKTRASFTAEAEALLLAYPWPGNVRELETVVRNLAIRHEGPAVTRDMLEPYLLAAASKSGPPDYAPAAVRPLAEVTRLAIVEALAACEGNVGKAAVLLGVPPSAIYARRGVPAAMLGAAD